MKRSKCHPIYLFAWVLFSLLCQFRVTNQGPRVNKIAFFVSFLLSVTLPPPLSVLLNRWIYAHLKRDINTNDHFHTYFPLYRSKCIFCFRLVFIFLVNPSLSSSMCWEQIKCTNVQRNVNVFFRNECNANAAFYSILRLYFVNLLYLNKM